MVAHNKKSKSNLTILNQEGVQSFKHGAMQELCDRVLTSYFGEDRFYETGTQSVDRITELVKEVACADPTFVAKLTVLAREQFNLRSTPQALAVELSKHHKGDSLVSKVIDRICLRADDMSNILAYAIERGETKKVRDVKSGMLRNMNKKIPNQIKKGLAKAFTKFDEYQLQKHPKSLAVQPIDVFRLVHPVPVSSEQVELWKRLRAGELAVAKTRETIMSEAGQKAGLLAEGDSDRQDEIAKELKAQGLEELIMARKMGYTAVIRNIIKFLEVGLSEEAHKMAQEFVKNENACKNSKVFPHQIFTAYMQVTKSHIGDPFARKDWLKALNVALHNSVKNVPTLKGKTAILVDRSGSMAGRSLSGHSVITCADISCVLGAMASHYCENSITIPFGSTFKIVDTSEMSNDIMADATKINNSLVGNSTHADKVIKYFLDNKIVVDNIQIFTDCVFNGGSYDGGSNFKRYLSKYRDEVNPRVVVYEVNLAGYGNTQCDPNNSKHVFMSGWSDASLKYMTEYQDLKYGIVDMVNSVEL